MREMLRQTAVLSILWALCELLLPQGACQRLVRLTAGILILTALLNTAGDALRNPLAVETGLMAHVQQATSESYRRTALTAMANQAQGYCQRMAQRAGYEAQAKVVICMDGSLDHISLQLSGSGLMPPGELCTLLAKTFGTQEERIWLEET